MNMEKEEVIKLRTERCEYLKNFGYTYDQITGEIFGVKKKPIKRKDSGGYIFINTKNPDFNLFAHHFAWYMTYGNVDYEQIDHINGDRSDNRIENLRTVTNQENAFNRRKAKGYSWNKKHKKYHPRIKLNGITYNLGYFDTAHEARQAYLQKKKELHIIG